MPAIVLEAKANATSVTDTPLLLYSLLYQRNRHVQKILSDPCCRWICLGWGGFTLENLILSENRTKIIEYFGKHGDATYHRIYNTLSTLACASVAFGYLRYRPGIQYIKRISNLRLALGFTIASVGAWDYPASPKVPSCKSLSLLYPVKQYLTHPYLHVIQNSTFLQKHYSNKPSFYVN